MRRNLCLIVLAPLLLVFSYESLLCGDSERVQNPIAILEQSERVYLVDACPDESNPWLSWVAPSLHLYCAVERSEDSTVVIVRDFSEQVLPEILAGENLLAAGATVEAREHYLKALSIDSTVSKLYVFIGDTYFLEGQYGEAKKWYQKAMEINPVDYQAYRFMADILERQGHLELAMHTLVAALIYNMNYDIAWDDLRRIGLKLGLEVTRHPFRHRSWMEPVSDTTYRVCIDSSVASSPEKLAAWFAFTAEKAVWQVEGKFFDETPTADQYHLTLSELYSCVNWLVSVWVDLKKKNPKISDPDLDFISRAAEDGFLKEYVLLEVLSQLDIHLLLELNLRDNLSLRFEEFFFRYYIRGT